jgi:shikimate dehydrogenase
MSSRTYGSLLLQQADMTSRSKSKSLDFLTNVIQLTYKEKYAIILGRDPSLTARSPKLWNYVYSQLNISRVMHPFDVEAQRFSELWAHISHDQNCIGGSVAAPYKEEVFKLLNGNTDQVTAQIGAVNCLYRSPDGRLFGTNTDGQGALLTIQDLLDDIQSSKILVFGLGGVGKSVAASISNVLHSKNDLLCSARNSSTSKFCKTIHATYIAPDELGAHLSSIDLFINCSSLGSGEYQNESPLSNRQLSLLKTGCQIFDVIYKPQKTKLLLEAERLGHQGANGERMNIEQAVKSFAIVNDSKESHAHLRKLMLGATG